MRPIAIVLTLAAAWTHPLMAQDLSSVRTSSSLRASTTSGTSSWRTTTLGFTTSASRVIPRSSSTSIRSSVLVTTSRSSSSSSTLPSTSSSSSSSSKRLFTATTPSTRDSVSRLTSPKGQPTASPTSFVNIISTSSTFRTSLISPSTIAGSLSFASSSIPSSLANGNVSSQASTVEPLETIAAPSTSATNDDLGVIAIASGAAFSNINSTSGTSNITNGLNYTSSLTTCDKVAEYYNQTQADWAKYDTDLWLSNWVGNQSDSIARRGFASVFGEWATGNPDLNCEDSGSRSNCDFQPCNIKDHNVRESELRQVYYVMTSLRRMHDFHIGLREAISVAGITTVFGKDGFVNTFFNDADKPDLLVMREAIGATSTVLGLIGCGVGFSGPVVANSGNALVTLFSGGLGAINPVVMKHDDPTFSVAGEVGLQMSKLYTSTISRITMNNNALMRGKSLNDTRSLRTFLKNGSFLAYPGLDKLRTTNVANQFMIAQTINAIWRSQKIFIIGGAACGDGQGIGDGPQDGVICRDGKAWYIYYWRSVYSGPLSWDAANWVGPPPGAQKLGRGTFANITLSDVINSSLDSFNVAGNNYTASVGRERMGNLLAASLVNPLEQGPKLEGTFTIPVCDIGNSPYKPDVLQKNWILQPYGTDKRPVWCDPALCSNEEEATRAFYKAANMEGWDKWDRGCTVSEWKWWLPTGM